MQPSADTIIAIFTQFTTTVMPFWLAFVVIFLSNITNGQNASEISDTEAHVNFIGWYANGVTIEALTDPGTWTTSDGFAVGCGGAGCSFATDCIFNTLLYDIGVSLACNGRDLCRTMTIFQASPAVLPTAINLFCAENWVANTVYREYPSPPSPTTETIFIVESSDPPTVLLAPSTFKWKHSHFIPKISAIATPVPVDTPILGLTPTVPGLTSALVAPSDIASFYSSPTSTPTDTASTENSENGWIAGAVLGPMAVLAILVAYMCWVKDRDRNNQSQATSHPHKKLLQPPERPLAPPTVYKNLSYLQPLPARYQ